MPRKGKPVKEKPADTPAGTPTRPGGIAGPKRTGPNQPK